MSKIILGFDLPPEMLLDDGDEEADYGDSDSDSDGDLPLSVEIFQPSKKARCTPSTSTKVTSPRVTRKKASNFKTKNSTYTLLPPITPRKSPHRAQSDVAPVAMTHVIPPHQTVPAFDFREAIDISVFGRKLPMACPVPPAETTDGFTVGKKCILTGNAEGKPEWVVTPYHFKVDESVVIGKGSFRTCYNAFGRTPGGEVTPMVAKKRRELPPNMTHLAVHKESGGVRFGSE
ncbi:uncharacterized protein MELLADRAFT_84181 [Melampsora larici-populina 98AG31]|uniref:Uncharacterized protein n=1 Tax=Melampsora larici-populina (strain 98AG31 / pathotype 3-4-7) TaxID=747676 RepID=F4SBU2_MELLP|nr:uncharacterized protein MELLADRAFT_84181 [Melampsora larici-populina 98AG31]EGF97894.1 hypothetical protein MELLADRAFT_84181 [Melampsora larici-populina 98AG31]